MSWFVPHEFSRHDLRYFSAFVNVRTLRLQNLEIYRFIPGVERYFGHFSPTLQSISLLEPRCTPRQLSYFLSLFSNLEDIEIERTGAPNTTITDTKFAPFSAPKLQGRLALYDFGWVETWSHLITSCDGLRFSAREGRLCIHSIGGMYWYPRNAAIQRDRWPSW